MTVEEMREAFLDQMITIVDYWRRCDLSNAAHRRVIDEQCGGDEVRYRMEGVLFSFLVLFDGGAVGLPAFDIVPAPHPDDEQYREDNDEDWWHDVVINGDVQLHDLIHEIRAARERD